MESWVVSVISLMLMVPLSVVAIRYVTRRDKQKEKRQEEIQAAAAEWLKEGGAFA